MSEKIKKALLIPVSSRGKEKARTAVRLRIAARLLEGDRGFAYVFLLSADSKSAKSAEDFLCTRVFSSTPTELFGVEDGDEFKVVAEILKKLRDNGEVEQVDFTVIADEWRAGRFVVAFAFHRRTFISSVNPGCRLSLIEKIGGVIRQQLFMLRAEIGSRIG